MVYTPAVFVRVRNKGLRGYGTWKSIRKNGGGVEEESLHVPADAVREGCGELR
jgi:hypothetical protein